MQRLIARLPAVLQGWRRARGDARTGAMNEQPARLRVLHLAFEDHRRPNAGGGATRTREINERLARRHDVTVVTSRYPGCRSRVEGRVSYRHAGLRLGHFGSIITYFLAVPWKVLTRRADVVVEDFASPIGSALVPLWTGRPTVAVVQWLFADETSKQYRLPFYVAEDLGLGMHTHFVAASGFMRAEIERRNPNAVVCVVKAGIDPATPDAVDAFRDPQRRRRVLYLGRFQVGGKGVDLLADAFESIAEHVADVELIVAGDGPERKTVERLFAERAYDVEVRPWVSGPEKWALLQSADVLALPSRYESFGLVALEAMSVGVPVVGFALPSLLELVPPTCGILTAPFEVEEYARAIVKLLSDDDLRATLSTSARAHAQTFTWDAAAEAQEAFYLDAVAAGRTATIPQRLRSVAAAARLARRARGAQ